MDRFLTANPIPKWTENDDYLTEITRQILEPLGYRGRNAVFGPLKLVFYTVGDRLCAKIRK